jgi:hypothetical protein
MFPQKEILAGGEFPVRRPEQSGFEVFITPIHIFDIFGGRCLPPVQMMKGMVPDGMSGPGYLCKYIRMIFYIVAHVEEGSLDIPFLQYAEHPGCDLRDRAIVKGEVDDFFRSGNGTGKVFPVENP